MAEMSEAENTQRIINKVIDNIVKHVDDVKKSVQHDCPLTNPYWNGYAIGLSYIDNQDKYMLPADVAIGIKAASDLISALEGISIDIMQKTNRHKTITKELISDGN